MLNQTEEKPALKSHSGLVSPHPSQPMSSEDSCFETDARLVRDFICVDRFSSFLPLATTKSISKSLVQTR